MQTSNFNYASYISIPRIQFFFYSNEGIPREPVHVHVRKGEAIAKIWILPNIQIADSYGLSSSELKQLANVTSKNKDLRLRNWNEYFGE